MKNTTNYKELFDSKKALIDVIDEVLEDIDYRERQIRRDYVVTGHHQKVDKDGNLIYRDAEGNKTTEVTDDPWMIDDYDEIMIDVENLNENARRKYDALCKVRDTIIAMV